MTSYSSCSSSSQSNGVLEIDLNRLPPYKRICVSSPAPSIASSPVSSRKHSRNVSNNEHTRFAKLTGNLRNILNANEWDFSDAEIIVDGVAVGVNRLVLASMSSFFHELFKKQKPSNEHRPRFYISNLVPNEKVGYEAFLLFLGYLYTGNLKPYPDSVSKCVDDSCPHDACHPSIDFQLQLLYASATFQIDELVSLLQADLVDVVEKAAVEDVIPILVAAFHCKLRLLQDHCIKRVGQSDIHNLWIDKILPYELQLKIRLFRVESMEQNNVTARMEFPDESRVKQTYQLLDRNDIYMLPHVLSESATFLDEIYGLHYAVAFCEPKLVRKILELGLANVNLRNSRGYTVLHMAARRMHPEILKSLFLRGAFSLDLVSDLQIAISICRRMTKVRDFESNEHSSNTTNNYRLCIEFLESSYEFFKVELVDREDVLPLEAKDLLWNLYINTNTDAEDANTDAEDLNLDCLWNTNTDPENFDLDCLWSC